MTTSRRGISPQQAVALAYHEGASAPKVVAKGRGMIAEAIVAKAREAGVYVHESSELVALLMEVDMDKNVPPELFRAVAELLAFIHYLESGVINKLDLASLLPNMGAKEGAQASEAVDVDTPPGAVGRPPV